MLIQIFKNTNPQNLNTLIQGADAQLNDVLAADLLKKDGFAEFEKVVVDCENDGLDNLIATLTESSLFSMQKIVLIKNPFFLTSKSPAKFKKLVDKLQIIFENLSSLTDIIIIEANYEKLDKRKKISKLVKSHFNVIDTSFKSYEIERIINSILKQQGYEITTNALHLLIDRSDHVMDTILSNIDKLKIIAVDNKITEKFVLENIDISLAQNVFEILTQAMNRNYQESIQRLNDCLNAGDSGIQLLGVFESQLEVLLSIKILQKRKRSDIEIAKALNIHPYRVKLGIQTRIEPRHLEQILKKAILLEFGYKNGTYHSDDFLKMFLLEI